MKTKKDFKPSLNYKYDTRICPVCGKRFIPAPYHVYKDKRKEKYVCSYPCSLESERQDA